MLGTSSKPYFCKSSATSNLKPRTTLIAPPFHRTTLNFKLLTLNLLAISQQTAHYPSSSRRYILQGYKFLQQTRIPCRIRRKVFVLYYRKEFPVMPCKILLCH